MAKSTQRDVIANLHRLLSDLDAAPAGLHSIAPPAASLPPGLPEPLIALYAACDGGDLFVEHLQLFASEAAAFHDGRWRFASLLSDDVAIDHHGRIWRYDESVDDDIYDGTRIDRWLAGHIDSLATMFDRDGEFAAELFDDTGEVTAEAATRQLRLRRKRDPAAPGIHWQLAQVLLAQGADDSARGELEQAVADDPAFIWAWLDLARLSERSGELRGAIDEARMAADAAGGMNHPQAGYFWSQLARFAAAAGDDLLRAEAAAKTSLVAPQLKTQQIAGASERLGAGDWQSAKGLLDLLRAVWPRDIEVLDLARRIEGAKP